MWAVDARSGSNGPSAVATLTPIALHSRALTKSAHIYEQLRHDDWVERRAGARPSATWTWAGRPPRCCPSSRASRGRRRRACAQVRHGPRAWGELAGEHVDAVCGVLRGDEDFDADGDAQIRWEAAIALPKVGAHALHEALAGDDENNSTPSALAAAAALLAARRDDADRDVRSKAAEVIDRTKDDYARLTAKRDRTVTRRRSDAEYCDSGDHPLLAIMEEWAKRAYRRMVPSKRALSLRVAGYVAAAAGAGADVVRRVLDREPGVAREADVLSKERRTMLHAAAAAGNGAALAPLLRAGADPGAADGHGATPLHLASRWGRAACVAALAPARAGAAAGRPRARRFWVLPLHEAARYGHAAAVAALLAAGADPLLRDGRAARTPRDVARVPVPGRRRKIEDGGGGLVPPRRPRRRGPGRRGAAAAAAAADVVAAPGAQGRRRRAGRDPRSAAGGGLGAPGPARRPSSSSSPTSEHVALPKKRAAPAAVAKRAAPTKPRRSSAAPAPRRQEPAPRAAPGRGDGRPGRRATRRADADDAAAVGVAAAAADEERAAEVVTRCESQEGAA
ncbi:hypothetical protein JL720_969 [Aureococcus anophagefferens]|nr:hypothetical protein JL720_969 [Aureococcus anophagefferens]